MKLKSIVLGAGVLSTLGVGSVVAHANVQGQGAATSPNNEISKIDKTKATAAKVDIIKATEMTDAKEAKKATEMTDAKEAKKATEMTDAKEAKKATEMTDAKKAKKAVEMTDAKDIVGVK